jgi:hypothetical protein
VVDKRKADRLSATIIWAIQIQTFFFFNQNRKLKNFSIRKRVGAPTLNGQ